MLIDRSYFFNPFKMMIIFKEKEVYMLIVETLKMMIILPGERFTLLVGKG